MKFKELKRVLAVALAVSCVAPNTVYAAEAVGIEQVMQENGWYYDGSGVLRNADGVAINEDGTPVEQATEPVAETPADTAPVTDVEPSVPEVGSSETVTEDNTGTDNGEAEAPEGGNEAQGGNEETPENPDGSGETDTGETPETPNGGSDNTGEQPENPDGGDAGENPDGGDTETPETPDGGDGDENTDGDEGEKPEEPDGGNGEDGGDVENPDNPGEPTDPEVPVDPEEPTDPEEPVTPEEPETPVEPEEPETPEKPEEPETPEEPEKPETPVEPEVPAEPTQEPTPEPTPEPAPEPEQPAEETPSNSGGNGFRVQMPVVSTIKDFRFYTIEKEYAFAREDISILEDTKDDARVIGTLPKDGMCFVMKDCDDGWTYVESGDVRGFVRNEKLYLNEEAQGVVDSLKQKAQEQTDKENAEIRKNIEERLKKEMTKNEGETDEAFAERFNKAVEEAFEKEKKPLIDFETLVSKATEVVSWKENNALAYTRATTRTFLAEKKFGLVNATALNVREGKGTDTRIVGLLPTNALVYILADADQEWIYIESGDVRGFVHRDYLKTGEEVDKEVAETGEENFPKVESKVDFKEVESLYYVRESVKEGQHSSKIREEIVSYAQQFLGNPYVWGGTDPVNGADCSGFVQSIYADFGYSLPRVAEDQAYYGERIEVADAQPGDLIFYMDSSGHIYHVVMYAGNGQTVEAMGSAYGITTGTVGGNACWATRIISEDDDLQSDAIIRYAEDGDYGQYLGNYKLTFYCPCEICCGQWANGITATGTTATEGRTIAVDPTVIPYGTEVIIGDRVYVAEDCGGAIKGNRIDVYVDSHEEALSLGVQYADVFVKN